jgi:folate-binding protein YgfZ
MALQTAALRDWVCLEARGDDAATFLHGQLSRAVLDLASDHAPLAAWADARGRVRAVLRVFRLPERWLMLTPRDGADELLKALRMFVLRSKVALQPAADVEVAALLGTDAAWLTSRGVSVDTPPNRLVRRDDAMLVRLGPSYWQAVGSAASLTTLTAGLATVEQRVAARAEIELGIPAVTPAIGGRFVAQMLNLDELDAVSFDKGCYPGQEIIARVHNLGGVKRRARRYAAPGTAPAPGTAVLAAGTAAGEVVRSAAADSDGCELLAVVDHAFAGAEMTCNELPLRELPLPFAVRLD